MLSKKDFVLNVLSKTKHEQELAKADDWRGQLNNWIKC